MKFNVNKTKIMRVSRSLTEHPKSFSSTIGETVLKESDDLDILGVTLNSKITFKNHLRSVSRANFQRIFILRKSWRVFHDRSPLMRCCSAATHKHLPESTTSTVLQCGARLPIHTLNYLTVKSIVPVF